MLVLLHNWVQGFQRSIIFFLCEKKKMTHYSHNVSWRLLIKQNTHVLFCAFCIVHCKRTCLCGCESATYSSKLPLRHMHLLVRQLVGTWAKWRLGPFVMGAPAHGSTTALSSREATGINRRAPWERAVDLPVSSCPAEMASWAVGD